jgi:membrane-bound lytic murein transglycosylase MltF
VHQAKQRAVRWCGCIVGGLLLSANLLGSAATQTSRDGMVAETPPAGPQGGDPAAEPPDDSELVLAAALKPWHGDFAAITERGFVRIVIPHDPMFLAYDGDRLIGLASEFGQELESFFKENHKANVRAVFMPMARDRIVPALTEGLADVAIANLTITPERAEVVAFTEPLFTNAREIVVSGPAAGAITRVDDLEAVGLHLRPSSSYYTHIKSLNEARAAAGAPAIPVTEVEETLEDYDLMDMVQAGLIPAIVVDEHKARFWAQIFEGVTLHETIAIHEGGEIAWALRKDAPELLAALTGFIPEIRKGSLLGNVLLKRYLASTKWLEKTDNAAMTGRFDELSDLFEDYAGRYELDWIMLIAQGYQESQLDQSTRSRVGAIGIMQVMPSTARDPVVGIPDISKPEANVHAGIKYLRFLRDRYFSDPAITPINQVFLALAAYNAGPGNISKARKKAAAMGLDPNVWFDNVEIATGKVVSREPVAYVRNILKYAVFFRLHWQTR